MINTEQLNIEGKRSGSGFVCQKQRLLNALSRATAVRVNVFDDDTVIGTKGFLLYLKALAGSNVVKVVPANGSASDSQTNGKGLKVICGNHQSTVPNGAWLKEKMAFTLCQVRVSPSYAVMPNMGAGELADALSKVLPFVATDADRPILHCIKVVQKDGKLTFTGSDGFSLFESSLDFEAGEAEALIELDDVKALIPALRKAKRVKLSFKQKSDGDSGDLLVKQVIAETELVKYSLRSVDGKYPDYDRVFPSEFSASANFDTKEAFNACYSLLANWFEDSTKPLYRPLVLSIAHSKLIIEAKEGRGQVEIPAETTGEAKVACAGNYITKALSACGGIVELKLGSAKQALTFGVDNCRCLVMPMNIPEATVKADAKVDAVAQAEAMASQAEAKQAEASEADAVDEQADNQPRHKHKGKHRGKGKARVPVAVA